MYVMSWRKIQMLLFLLVPSFSKHLCSQDLVKACFLKKIFVSLLASD